MNFGNVFRHTGELPQFLNQCDYIVNIMPSTPDTRGMLGKGILQHAKYVSGASLWLSKLLVQHYCEVTPWMP